MSVGSRDLGSRSHRRSQARKRPRTAPFAALALLAGLLAVVGVPATAQEVGDVTVVPIQVTGPASERLNLIILCDGYQAHEMQACRDDVDRNQNVQWAVEPFRSYRNYFNVYRVEIVSEDSGVRCDPDDNDNPNNDLKDTALRLWYSDGCTNPLARGITYGPAPAGSPPGTPNGNTARTNILNTYVAPVLGIPASSQNVQTLAIANTFTYGGIGGTHATTSGGSPQGPLISLHELGHSLGQMADEYPYSSRDVPGGPHPDSEPGSFHHTRLTDAEMLEQQVKWWRWLGEESESGGIIRARGPEGHESGLYRSSNVWRPSEHSIMRWIGFYFDQVGREHMTYRITGRRNANAMALSHTPTGEVGADDVVWVETQHPKYHELDVEWAIDGATVPGTNNSRNLDLGELDVESGDVVSVTVKDATEFVRDPAFKDGPRMTQSRSWTVGAPLPVTPVDASFTNSTQTDRPVGGDDVVFVETTHPTDRVLDVTWRLNGAVVPNPDNSRNFNLGEQNLSPGSHELSATVTDPADPGGESETLTWTVDNELPSAPRELSEPLTALSGDTEHNVYFGEFTMGLEPQDDEEGFVVGEFRLNGDGWFNYFGFPDQPFGTPFKFSHSGTVVKALTYGNLGTGGLSKAAFEQSYPDFEPGYGTHTVEHRAIDASGNIGSAESFKATVLPGESPECTTTLTGKQEKVVVWSGVTCLEDANVVDGVRVRPGASLVASNSSIKGGLESTGAGVVQLFGGTVNGRTRISETTGDVTIAGTIFNGELSLRDNEVGDYGVVLAGNTIKGMLSCSGNTPDVTDMGAPNSLRGGKSGQCASF
jgi:hypothetical protein